MNTVDSYTTPLLVRKNSVHLARANTKHPRDFFPGALRLQDSYLLHLNGSELGLTPSAAVFGNSDWFEMVRSYTETPGIAFIKTLLAKMVELQPFRNRAVLELPHVAVGWDAFTISFHPLKLRNPARSSIAPIFNFIRRFSSVSMAEYKLHGLSFDPAIFFLGLRGRLGLLTTAAVAVTMGYLHGIHCTTLGLRHGSCPTTGVDAPRRRHANVEGV